MMSVTLPDKSGCCYDDVLLLWTMYIPTTYTTMKLYLALGLEFSVRETELCRLTNKSVGKRYSRLGIAKGS